MRLNSHGAGRPPARPSGVGGNSRLAPAPRQRGLALGSSVALRPAAHLRALRLPGTPRREMAAWMRGKDSSRCLLLLAAVLMVESSQLGSSRAKLNSIKSSLGGETPAQVANRSAGTYQGLAFGGSKKGKSLGQVGKHSEYPPRPRAVAASAPERVVCLCTPQPSKGAPRWGASHGWGGVPRSRSPWVGVGGGGWCWRAGSRRVTVPPPLLWCVGMHRIQCVLVRNGPSPNLPRQCSGEREPQPT